MADQLDPLLLRAMRGIMSGNTQTRGAGLVDNPSIMRTLGLNQPRVMGSFAPAKPGAGFMPPKGNPSLTQSEQPEGILPNKPEENAFGYTPADVIKNQVQSHNMWNTPRYGPMSPEAHGPETGVINYFKAQTANDPRNPLADKLEGIRRYNKDNDFKYQSALSWQRMGREKPQSPVPMGQLSPLNENIKPREPLSTHQIYSTARTLEGKGLKEDASKLRKYNFMTEQFRDKIKDYNLAKTDLHGWVEKNSVPDINVGLEDMERLNKFLTFSKQPPLNFIDYKELKRYELQQKMREQGPDKFFGALKSDLTTMHSELDRIHKLVEENKE